MIKKFKFYTNLGCRCSETSEIVEIDIPDNFTAKQEELMVNAKFNQWVFEKNCDSYWMAINESEGE